MADQDALRKLKRRHARLVDDIQLTVAETHERTFKDLRGQIAALRTAIAKACPPSRGNLDWI